MPVKTGKLVAESRYHNPDPLICLLGCANKTKVVVGGGDDGIGGYLVPNLFHHWGVLYRNGVKDPFTEECDKGCVASQGEGDIFIPYKGYVEANLTIPYLPWYNDDVLFLVVSNHKYRDRDPVQIGTQVIDQLVAAMAKKQLQEARETWKQVHFGTIFSKQITVKGLDVPEYDLQGVKGKIHTIREVVIPYLWLW